MPGTVSVPSFEPSHRSLLGTLDVHEWRTDVGASPGAIVVPTARPATCPRSGVGFAARLAQATRRPLVVVVSKDAATKASLADLSVKLRGSLECPPPDTLILHLSDTPTSRTAFAVDQLEISRAWRRGRGATGEPRLAVNDVGRKRNLAVLLARAMHWRTLLFLDDDVFDDVDGEGTSRPRHPRTLDPITLSAAVAAVESGPHSAVGWTLRDFDDNSVLCRIRAAMGRPQEQFVGAGALLVDVEADLPFFPAIYNEDWLFLLRLLTAGLTPTPVLDGGDVRQDAYDPFPASRAASEELGDLIGEGLLSLHQCEGRSALPQTTAGFWREAIALRMRMREELEAALDSSDHPGWGEMRKALDAVKAVHERFLLEEHSWVDQIRTFVETWHSDLEIWRRRLYRDAPPQPRSLMDTREFVPSRAVVMGAQPSIEAFVEEHRARFG